jgi:hypothetical protein
MYGTRQNMPQAKPRDATLIVLQMIPLASLRITDIPGYITGYIGGRM